MSPDPTPLARLHDIHLPPAAGPDWGLLLLALLLATAGLALLGRALWRRRRRWRVAARLRALRPCEPAARLSTCAMLLREKVHADDPAAGAYRLSGEAWLEQLDRRFATRFFTEGAGRVFGTDLYRHDLSCDWPQVERALRRFLG